MIESISKKTIPNIIHYCWFGSQHIPDIQKKYIQTWQKLMPGYEIILWNEKNFDISLFRYTSQAYSQQKYAFVSDVARFWILYNHGGIYLDTDVELLKSLQSIVDRGPFMGCEYNQTTHMPMVSLVNPGLGMACYKNHPIFKEILDEYLPKDFDNQNIETVTKITTDVLTKHGLSLSQDIQKCEDISIYPSCYFSPKSYKTKQISITPETLSIHHFAASWLDDK